MAMETCTGKLLVYESHLREQGRAQRLKQVIAMP